MTDRVAGEPGRRRPHAAMVAAGLVMVLGAGAGVVLGAGVGVARAREPVRAPGDGGRDSVAPPGTSADAGTLAVPQIDAGKSRRTAVDYLVARGVPRGEAAARIDRQPGQVRAAVALRRRAPQDVRSVWIGDAGKLMASVVNAKGRQAALAAGATPADAPKVGMDLQTVRDTLATHAKGDPPPEFAGASFAIDPVGGKVIAHYLFTAHPQVPAVVQQFGDVVTASADIGALQTMQDVGVAGSTMRSTTGENAGEVCTAGWAVDIEDPNGRAPGNGVMTAGHCFNGGDPAGTAYEIDTTAAGNTQSMGEFSSLGPAGDYGYLRLERDRGTATMRNFLDVEAVEEPVVGTTVCMHGAVTGMTCGMIQRVGVTTVMAHEDVNYLVKGQVRTDLCGRPGDSGAPVYMDYDKAMEELGIAALGIISNGVEDSEGRHCTMNFQPLSGIDNQDTYHVRIHGG